MNNCYVKKIFKVGLFFEQIWCEKRLLFNVLSLSLSDVLFYPTNSRWLSNCWAEKILPVTKLANNSFSHLHSIDLLASKKLFKLFLFFNRSNTKPWLALPASFKFVSFAFYFTLSMVRRTSLAIVLCYRSRKKARNSTQRLPLWHITSILE